MPTKDRLRHLLELAADPRAGDARGAQAASLRNCWPTGRTASRPRAPFEALLKKVTPDQAPSLTDLLRKGQTEAAVAALAQAGGADADTVRHALAEESGAELAALCREAGINRATFSDIAILAGPAHGAELSSMKRVLDAFDTGTDSNVRHLRFG